MKRVGPILALLAGLAGCGAGGVERVEAAVVASNPTLSLERDVDRTPVHGTVAEVRSAGGYGYVRLEGGEAWYVGLEKGVGPGEAVRIGPVGRARQFHSARTGHTYDELVFGVVSKVRE